jgi:threonine dehydrogenase-like Zn-dependent dehydrogenase
MDRIRDAYDFAALNTHHFPFDKIHEAFEVAIHDKENAFKVMLTF